MARLDWAICGIMASVLPWRCNASNPDSRRSGFALRAPRNDAISYENLQEADDHNAPGRANAPEALRAKMGQNAELAKSFAAKMPNARAEVIADTGHLVFLEAPKRYKELVLGFLGQ